MKPTLVQCQVRAILIGLLWVVPYLSILKIFPASAFLVFVLGFPILVAFIVAVVTGPFDRLAFVSLLIPAGCYSVVDIHHDWVWHARHNGTLLGSSPILDLIMIVATVLLAIVGIIFKRWLVNRPGVELSPQEVRSLYRCLSWDIGLVAAIAVLVLGIDAVKIPYENDPPVLAETRRQILTSPTSTEADKLQVVMKLGIYRWPESRDNLLLALKDPSPVVKIAAAAILLQRGDSTGLPVLEAQLMQTSTITITNEHQVIHADWLGYSEGGPTTLTFDLSSALGAITDPNVAPILKRLTASTNPDIKSGAFQALANIQLYNVHPQLNWMH